MRLDEQMTTTETAPAARAFLILHGWDNFRPPGHWQHELAVALRRRGERVVYPQLPDAATPSVGGWRTAVSDALAEAADGGARVTVLCHSLACLLWLGARPADDTAVERVLLVAPPSRSFVGGIAEIAAFAALEPSRPAAPATIAASDDDPNCPEGAHAAFGDPLGIPVVTIPAGATSNERPATASGHRCSTGPSIRRHRCCPVKRLPPPSRADAVVRLRPGQPLRAAIRSANGIAGFARAVSGHGDVGQLPGLIERVLAERQADVGDGSRRHRERCRAEADQDHREQRVGRGLAADPDRLVRRASRAPDLADEAEDRRMPRVLVSATEPRRRSAARVYCVRSFVPIDANAASRRTRSARSAAEGISTMTPAVLRPYSFARRTKYRVSSPSPPSAP